MKVILILLILGLAIADSTKCVPNSQFKINCEICKCGTSGTDYDCQINPVCTTLHNALGRYDDHRTNQQIHQRDSLERTDKEQEREFMKHYVAAVIREKKEQELALKEQNMDRSIYKLIKEARNSLYSTPKYDESTPKTNFELLDKRFDLDKVKPIDLEKANIKVMDIEGMREMYRPPELRPIL